MKPQHFLTKSEVRGQKSEEPDLYN